MTRALWSAFGCVLLLAGCVSAGNPHVTNDATLALIRVGETTKSQVLALLGLPEDQRSIEMAQSTKEWWRYTYATAVINPLDYLLLYGFWVNGIGTFDHQYDLSLYFDDKGVVSSLSLLSTSYDLGGPVHQIQVSSSREMAISRAGPTGATVRFVDAMEYRE